MKESTLDKIKKILPEETINEFDGFDQNGLRKVIADANEAILTATKERDENEAYQQAKQAVKDLSAGLKDVKKFQNAKIQYCLHRLRESA